MPNYIKVIVSGDVIEVEEYFSPRQAGSSVIRGSNQNLTTAQQQERNINLARKKLSRKINANFTSGDYFITLTYNQKLEDDAVKRELKNYFNRLRAYCKKNKLPDLKYIVVTEKSKRIHHHMVLNKVIPFDVLIDKWNYGRVIISKMDNNKDYTGLARYITKESTVDQKRRWTCSRNLLEPVEIRTEIKRRTKVFALPPKYRKTYMVMQEEHYFSIKTGEIRYLKAIRIGGADLAA